MQREARNGARRLALALIGTATAVVVAGECWKNQAPVNCAASWTGERGPCELDPPGQQYMYANQCGTGSGKDQAKTQSYCSYVCDGDVVWRYDLKVVDANGRICELPPCGSGT